VCVVNGAGRRSSEKRDSLVVRTARALAAMSAAAVDGAHLGSENDLLERLGVSRPTLRQAAKIVESDRLIVVKRGTRGGFFAARPSARDVIRAPALFLRMNGATIADVHVVTRLIMEEAAAEAARCDDEGLREAMRRLRARIAPDDAIDETPAAMLQHERELAELLGRMCGNPAIALFMEIGFTFGLMSADLHFYQNTEDRRANRAHQRGLCDAVLAHDAEVARLMMKRRSEMVAAWIADGSVLARAAE
jgi:GntR family transcriptional repressor for pyruvate dehydrogenase complex